ncbi:hypothetical protein BK816_06360 [Boudabousia tangfeifanii]|uniref:Septum formation initiator n=1 Tax=Boudabousia tangfeifanii TaxID=1912795 RepID=A0A1D9ML48_9ACTO|nr:hypothetical protein BK816_06360 [Boudabousia tangfeifanii]
MGHTSTNRKENPRSLSKLTKGRSKAAETGATGQKRGTAEIPAGAYARRPAARRPRNSAPSVQAAPVIKADGTVGEVSYQLGGFILLLIVLVLFLISPIKQLLSNQQEYRQVQVEIANQKALQAELKDRLAQWNDPDFVASQARERLGYARPGETQYLITGKEVPQQIRSQNQAEALSGPVRPWFLKLSDSLVTTNKINQTLNTTPTKEQP